VNDSPLHLLIGTWESQDTGLDVSFHSDQGKIGEGRFRERVVYQPRGVTRRGSQEIWTLDYTLSTWLLGSEEPFHVEVGYWTWEPDTERLYRCFLVPHATALVARGRADGTVLRLEAERLSDPPGIVSAPGEGARISRFDATITLGEDEYSYQQTTVIEYPSRTTSVLHTDRNTLHRVR
jgi:hypothetical protein